MIKKNQISIIIPTYNRSKELEITLKSIRVLIPEINEVIIVDQSTNDKTKKLISKFGKKVKYVYSKIPSITIARNLGVRKSSKKSELICFIDDDVSLGKDYFDKIIEVFNKNSKANGVAGWFAPKNMNREDKIENFIKKLFFIIHFEENKARIVSAYGNTYPYKLDRIINVEWFAGVNMVYKKEVFEKEQFDERFLGYAIAEDTDFTYRLYKRDSKSLFLIPNTGVIHRESTEERYPTKKMSYINQIDHFYFFFKDFDKTIFNKFKFVWSLVGISILRVFKALFSGKKQDRDKAKYFFDSLSYCLNNLDKIKKGKIREFSV